MNKENNKIKNPVKLTLYTAHTLSLSLFAFVFLCSSFSILFQSLLWLLLNSFFSTYEIHKTQQYNNKMYVCKIRDVYYIRLSFILCQRNNWFDPFLFRCAFYFLSFLIFVWVCLCVSVLSRANEKHTHDCTKEHTYTHQHTQPTVNYLIWI